MKIYLAGGMRSGWQNRVKIEVPGHTYADPSQHRLTSEEDYAFWNLVKIAEADIVLAYLERDNPGGYSLALAIGYAKALGKRIIFVDEKSQYDTRAWRYLGMTRACADLTFDLLEYAIEFLQHL